MAQTEPEKLGEQQDRMTLVVGYMSRWQYYDSLIMTVISTLIVADGILLAAFQFLDKERDAFPVSCVGLVSVLASVLAVRNNRRQLRTSERKGHKAQGKLKGYGADELPFRDPATARYSTGIPDVVHLATIFLWVYIMAKYNPRVAQYLHEWVPMVF